jgi:predicted nicotinamide N-methyase
LDNGVALSFQQAPYGPEGFASTVWDSSIVLAKAVEARAGEYAGKSIIDLSSGVGVVAAVAAAVVPRPARVVATDLAPNLPLLAANLRAAAAAAGGGAAAATAAELRWGDAAAAAALGGAFDIVLAADVSYIPDAVAGLAASIDALLTKEEGAGAAWIAHGRNRGAWPALRDALRARGLAAALVEEGDLHPDYVAVDVDVWRCVRGGGGVRRCEK